MCLKFDSTGSFAIMLQRRAPIVFLSVCRRWRQIAMNLPGLWASLQVSPTNMDHIQRMTTWINLAGHSPLSISLTCRRPTISDCALDLILRH